MNPLIVFDSPRVFENADGSKIQGSTLAKLSEDLLAEREPPSPTPGEPSYLVLKINPDGPLVQQIGGAVTSVGASSPLTITGTATAPVVNIPPASGLTAGSQSIAHFNKVNGIETGADVTDFENVSAALALASGPVSVNGERITNVGGSAGTDAASRSYADTTATAAANAAATSNSNWRTASAALAADPSFNNRVFTSVLGVSVASLATFTVALDVTGAFVVTHNGIPLLTINQDGIGFFNTPASPQPANIAPLTDDSGGTAGGFVVPFIPDPINGPVSADALRDDLVANILPPLRNAIAELTAKVNALNAALESVGLLSS